MLSLLVASALAATTTVAPPSKAVLTIAGLDCEGCEKELVEKIEGVAGVQGIISAFDQGRACLTLSASVSSDAIAKGLAHSEFSLVTMESAPACPADLVPVVSRDPWSDAGGLDASVISSDGAMLPLVGVPGKFTVFDFGAKWCGPCHIAARDWKIYLSEHRDVAVRAITLPGADAQAAFRTPIAATHLRTAAGIPYFVVHDPNGKEIYRGGDTKRAQKLITGARR